MRQIRFLLHLSLMKRRQKMDHSISDFTTAENPNNSSVENTKCIGKTQQPTPLSTQNVTENPNITLHGVHKMQQKQQRSSPHIMCV